MTGIVGPTAAKSGIVLVTREEWKARESRDINYLEKPVDMIFIHHTKMKRCHDKKAGCREMRVIQDFHMNTRGWDDVGYSFLVAEDGYVYEARGWDRVGAHTSGYNSVALAVSVMGDFETTYPDPVAIEALQNIIKHGVEIGKLLPNYKLYGHRDGGNTTCPGDKLYELIQTWSHYDSDPPKRNPIGQLDKHY